MAKILIVDDSSIIRVTLRAILENAGHEIVGEAQDGLAGYDLYFQLKPDIIITDLTMPLLDGITAIHKIREKDSAAKIMLVTSNTNTEKIKEAVIAGVTEILFKPVNESQLIRSIDQIMQREK